MSRSGYYFWQYKLSHPDDCRQNLDKAIREEFGESKGTYGSPRIHAKLKARQLLCCLNTVSSRMKTLGLKVQVKKKFSVKTTTSDHNHPIAPRVFKAESDLPKEPNKIWAGDITYLRVGSDFYYLSVVLDLFHRQAIGWSVDKTLEASGVIKALKSAILTQNADAKIIFHSDRGSQYASKVFRDLLAKREFVPSMSRKGNCYDNCYVESFFKTLKSDLGIMDVVLTVDNVVSEIFRYIETWYNRKRIHSSLNYMSPIDFKQALTI